MPRVLVRPPTFYGVEYVINPWMSGNVGDASQLVAERQWNALVSILDDLANVSMIEPRPGLPDMCFAANGGFALDGTFVPVEFSVAQRAPEADFYRNWAESAGFDIADFDEELAFEGEGDALWWPSLDCEPLLWAGYGVRSSLESHRELAERLRVRVVSLKLADERFYQLDTCFAPLPDGRVVYYPPAFDQRSRRAIEAIVPAERRITIGDRDAYRFACNAVRLGNTFVSNYASAKLRRGLEAWGYDVVTTPLSEFIKAGGGAKCLALVLDQDVPRGFGRRPRVESPIRSETMELEGHLLDRGIMTHAFDAVNQAGGSFRLERFRAGERADQPSHARFTMFAPDKTELDGIVDVLQPLGA